MILREVWKQVLVHYVRGWCAKRFLCKNEADRKEVCVVVCGSEAAPQFTRLWVRLSAD